MGCSVGGKQCFNYIWASVWSWEAAGKRAKDAERKCADGAGSRGGGLEQSGKPISDNLREGRVGRHLGRIGANPCLNFPNLRCQRASETERLMSRFLKAKGIDKDGNLLRGDSAGNARCESAGRLAPKLLTPMRALGGGPSRGEELAALTFSDSRDALRSARWMLECIMILTSHGKMVSMAGGGARLAPRHFPKCLPILILACIAAAKPLESLFAGRLLGRDAAKKSHRRHLLCRHGERMSGEQARSGFALEMREALGFSLKYSERRHAQKTLPKALIKDKLGCLRENPGAAADASEARGSQRTHTPAAGEHLHGIRSLDHPLANCGERLSRWLASAEWSSSLSFSAAQVAGRCCRKKMRRNH